MVGGQLASPCVAEKTSFCVIFLVLSSGLLSPIATDFCFPILCALLELSLGRVDVLTETYRCRTGTWIGSSMLTARMFRCRIP
jgi:hypothetical protein